MSPDGAKGPKDPVSTRPLLDKLGVKPDSRVALLGGFPDWFNVLVMQRASEISERAPSHPVDLVFLMADSLDELAPLKQLRESIVQDGAIWVVSRKGKGATLRDMDVISAAFDAGLVDNKVVSFSETHTSLRLVIRLRDRIPSQKQRS
jgi:hypothetical protein